MGNTKQPGRKGSTLPPEGRDRLKGIEKDLLSYILCLHFVSYFENHVTINPIEVFLI